MQRFTRCVIIKTLRDKKGRKEKRDGVEDMGREGL